MRARQAHEVDAHSLLAFCSVGDDCGWSRPLEDDAVDQRFRLNPQVGPRTYWIEVGECGVPAGRADHVLGDPGRPGSPPRPVESLEKA